MKEPAAQGARKWSPRVARQRVLRVGVGPHAPSGPAAGRRAREGVARQRVLRVGVGPHAPYKMTAAAVFEARRRLRGRVVRTPIVRSAWLSRAARADVHLKLESVQAGHSFKLRGAYNAILARIDRGERPERVVTASAGNHGRAMALVCRAMEIPLTVFAPAGAPATKLNAIRDLGADLRTDAASYDEAESLARAAAATLGAFVSPYDDPDVIAGAGTLALEILEDLPDLEAVVAPVGGGGLIAGIGLVVQAAASPRVAVMGAEADASPAFRTALAAGRVVPVEARPTLADGLAGNLAPETITFGLVQRLVDRVVGVSEGDLAEAILGLAAEDHIVAEGAGAAAAAALAGGRLALPGRRTVVVISGGNIDAPRLTEILARTWRTPGP